MEKEEIRLKDILKKATAMFHRYMENSLSLNEMERELERVEEKTSGAIREILLAQWIDAILLEKGNEKAFRGIEFLKGRSVDDTRQKLELLQSEYRQEKRQIEEMVRRRLEETLKKEGIHGSAVVPHVRGSEEWRKNMEATQQTFKGRVEEIKEGLRKL